MTRKQQNNLAGLAIFLVNFCAILTGSNNLRFHGNDLQIEEFNTCSVGFGWHMTCTPKIVKIPDIAWPTFFDSYRESMLKTKRAWLGNGTSALANFHRSKQNEP